MNASSVIPIAETAAGVVLAVRVVPRAGRTGVAGTRGDALLIRLTAAPVDGAANDALIKFVAELFDRPQRDVTIVSGQSARDKRVAISGIRRSAVEASLSAILRK